MPGAPIAFTATAAAQGAVLTWVPPSNGGSPLTGYRLYVAPIGGVFDIASDQSAIAVSNLSPDISHTFTLTAINAVGQGPGAVSGAVQPFVGTLYSPFSSYDKLVIQQYRDFLGRSPTSTELATERQRLIGHEDSPESLIDRLAHGVRFGDTYGPVARLYFAYFLRAPDLGGLDHWRERYRTGTSLAAISQAFASSSEFQTRYGAMSNRQFVETVYLNVLGRPGNESGIAYWTGQLNAGKKTRGAVMTGFSESSEYIRVRTHEIDTILIYRGMLGRVPTKAEFAHTVDRLDDSNERAHAPHLRPPPLPRVHVARRPLTAPTSGQRLEILDCRAFSRSANSGWPSDQTWASSSRSTASSWSSTWGDVGQRRLGPAGQLRRGASRPGRPARRRRPRSASSSTQRHASPTRSASSPSSTSPNSTTAAAACGPAMRWNIQVWPPPGWMPSCRNRVSNRARRAGEPHVARQRQVHAGADGGAVDGGDRRQRAAGDPQEALVDATQARRAATTRGGDRSAPAQNAGGAPVTTTAPTPSSASSSSNAGDDLVDHVEGRARCGARGRRG